METFFIFGWFVVSDTEKAVEILERTIAFQSFTDQDAKELQFIIELLTRTNKD
tara:strand:- start:11912 stop:12070 length:159 start_codon:yes stop_codon:yes gene_type:complete